MSQELVIRVKEIINDILYITIASCSHDLQPWNTPVYAVHDKQLNFFWRSWKKSEHSVNIQRNPNVFIVVYDTTRQLGQNHRRCVYIQAKAYEIDDQEEVKNADSLFPEKRREPLENFLGWGLKRLYKAMPEKIWLNDLSESEVTAETTKMRVEIPLKDLME